MSRSCIHGDWAPYGLLVCLLGVPLFWSGCSSTHYRKSADKEVYGIVQQVENEVFGHTNAFTIDTPYSGRDVNTILPEELADSRVSTNELMLTLDGALDLATRSRQYQDQKELLYLTALRLTGRQYEFRPNFFATVAGSFNRNSAGEQFGTVNSQVGVSQLLQSGGSLGVTLANDLLRYYTGDPRRSAVSTISVNLVQPLLRGFGRNNDAVEALTQAERDVVYAVRDYGYFQEQYAVGIVSDYFDLLAQKDIIRNRYTNYLSRVQSTRRLEARAHDRESLSDVDQARQAELTAKNNYVNSLAAYLTSLDQFKITLGLPHGVKVQLDDQVLRELEDTGLVAVKLDREAAYRYALAHQLQVLNSIDTFEDSKRKVRVAADKLKPNLLLLADASVDSKQPTDYANFDPDQIRAGVGLQLDLPVDRLPQRNVYRQALVSFEAELRNLTLTFDTVQNDISRGLRDLEQRWQNYTIQTNALGLADRRVKSVTLLLEAGRAEVRDLVDAQDAQISAQNAVTAARVAYQAARLNLMLAIGAIETETDRFWLHDQLGDSLARATTKPQGVELLRDRLIPPEEFFNN